MILGLLFLLSSIYEELRLSATVCYIKSQPPFRVGNIVSSSKLGKNHAVPRDHISLVMNTKQPAQETLHCGATFHWIFIYKNLVCTPQEANCLPIRWPYYEVLFRETISVWDLRLSQRFSWGLHSLRILSLVDLVDEVSGQTIRFHLQKSNSPSLDR